MPPPIIDPSDAVLKRDVKAFLTRAQAPAASRYKVVRFDLNKDGRRDALVLFETPYGYWCGKDGCSMLVMKAANDSFSVVNSIEPIREPLYISEEETNGWKDLVVRVSGRWTSAKDVAMQYDGHKYPTNPDTLPPYERFAMNDYIRVFRE